MILPHSKDSVHKAWLYRLLSGMYDDLTIASALYFKGGICAAMLGYLDRFSVDLDFDFIAKDKEMSLVRDSLEKVFHKTGLVIKDKSQKTLQYFLRYPSSSEKRNTLKIDVTFPPPEANQYEAKRFNEIDRVIMCQNIETMFANKLVALVDRYKKNNSIAGRDVYDIHHFFFKGFSYNKAVIQERTKKTPVRFFKELVSFVEENITETIITQDLNVLLPYEKFRKIRRVLKQEVLMFLKDEIERLNK